MNNYSFTKSLDMDFNEAEKKVTEELKKEGFGVLTRIDLKEKFKEKLDLDFRKYVILGACNPPFAHKSILAEEKIGLMLPCNVIVYENDKKQVNVSIIRPLTAMGMIDNGPLKALAGQVEGKLERVINNI